MKTKELNKRGVSLIVLVITIIVMVILAGVIILTLDNSGIINKAQDAVDQANLNEVKNVAQLAWAEAFLDGKTTQEELEQAVMDALAEQNITEEHYKGYTIEVTTSGVSFVETDGENNSGEVIESLNHSGIIPEGGQYISGIVFDDETGGWKEVNKVTYNAGDTFPTEISSGDRYIYGDYMYIYGYMKGYTPAGWEPFYGMTGWGVGPIDSTKTEYGEILQCVNNLDVVGLDRTFKDCTELVTAPKIPEGILSLEETFSGCTSLITAPTIPNGVTSLYMTFNGCTSLTTAPKIPSSVTGLGWTFFGCTSLVKGPDLSEAINVTAIEGAFNGCTSMTIAPDISNMTKLGEIHQLFSGLPIKTYIGSKDAEGDFSNYIIPNAVYEMAGAFDGCTYITNAPTIPSSAQSISAMFNNCTSLTGIVTVNADPQAYDGFLSGTEKPIVLTGSSTMLQELAGTATNNNVTVQE